MAVLIGHEPCVASGAGVTSFDVVTTVPSSSRERDESHPLRRIVGEVGLRTRDRYERLLTRSSVAVPERAFDPGKYEVARSLAGRGWPLIDDTWTTGSGPRARRRRSETQAPGRSRRW